MNTTRRRTAITSSASKGNVPKGIATSLRANWMLYAMVVPGVIWLIMFRYIPIGGSVIAFQDFQIFRGIWHSPWVGLHNFSYLLQYPDFYRILANTFILGLYTIVFGFPVPVILALMINEVRSTIVRRSTQTVLYLPHFFSWVIIAGIAFELLGSKGIVNVIRGWFGLDPKLFVQIDAFFRPMVTAASIYRDSGWGTIIYLAAIAGINPELYEAATIDGAGRFQRLVHITFPSILPTAVVLLLLQIGRFMDLGFDRVWVFLTPMTNSVGDIFDTFVFRVGVTQGQYSLTTAMGMFQALVGLVLIVGLNRLTKRISGGLW